MAAHVTSPSVPGDLSARAGELPTADAVGMDDGRANAVAAMILAGFDRHYALFRYSAQRGKTYFEQGDWPAMTRLARARIDYYAERVRECADEITRLGPPDEHAQDFWLRVKRAFVERLADHRQPECAETFFNSVTTRVLHRRYFHNDYLFVRPAIATDYLDSARPSYRVYYPQGRRLNRMLERLVAEFGLACPYDDLPRDISRLARAALPALRRAMPHGAVGQRLGADLQLQVLSSLFFRGECAYIVGRVINHAGAYPFAIALRRSRAGQLTLDALLHGVDDLSALFSFTRAYFLVDMETPSAYIGFLASVLPRKPVAELYTSLGLHKQGKTLFYRDFLHHLAHSHDQFDIAPGIRGMVMCVFTLPSYPYVFKLIRDDIQKSGIDRGHVMRKYQLVKRHDRVGRMADTWEYSQVALPRARFSPALIDALQAHAGSSIEVEGDTLILRHVYIERRMTPLNLYLQHADDIRLRAAVIDYGHAIRQLACANIFPGDLLYKNFGVTRLGRVVFYDYDEIELMTDIHFRVVPPAPDYEAELASAPWYPVAGNDVFPEEFAPFLMGNARVRDAFMTEHAELLDARWWQACRSDILAGQAADPIPYEPVRRLRATPSESGVCARAVPFS